MAEAPNIVSIDTEPATQQFITPPAEKQIEVHGLALFDAVNHIASMLVQAFVMEINALENAQAGQSEAAIVGTGWIEQFTRLDANSTRHQSRAGALLALELHGTDSNLRTAFHFGKKV